MFNIILNADSYKASHYMQYPPGIQYVSSYIEARGGDYDQVLFFGLQVFLKKYLESPITSLQVQQAAKIIKQHGLPFNQAGWQYIIDVHNGYLPIMIEAVNEGSVVPTGNVLCQVVNTDPECFWLTSYIETALLRAVWYPCTVATRSRQIKNNIEYYLDKTADSKQSLPFMLHDFGARGCSSLESSELGGMAHMINFLGSDNLAAIMAAQEYYDADVAGYSVPAAEHGTITSWGELNEVKAYENMLEKFKDFGAVSVVSDSYDLFHAVDDIWGQELKSKVDNFGGVVVIRPDSGDPVAVIRQTLKLLAKNYGVETNSKGYKLLPPNVRVIQGDGISEGSISAILAAVASDGFSAENLVFGMGAELLQKLNRDTLGFAMKVSAVNIKGTWHEVAKRPKTDSFKSSRKGRLALVDGQTIKFEELDDRVNQLQPRYRNGKFLHTNNWEQIIKGL